MMERWFPVMAFALAVGFATAALAQQTPAGTQPQVQVDPKVAQTFQGDDERILSDQLTEWKNTYLARLSKIEQDWAATWAGWCGSRPLCGLQARVATSEAPQSRGPLPHSEAARR